jgi:hypothetical protein
MFFGIASRKFLGENLGVQTIPVDQFWGRVYPKTKLKLCISSLYEETFKNGRKKRYIRDMFYRISQKIYPGSCAFYIFYLWVRVLFFISAQS